jgi:predicted Zn-dependent protease
MKAYQKPIIQGSVLVGSFALIWFLFQLINWSPITKHKKVDIVSEKKIGEILWEGIKQTEKVSSDSLVIGKLDSLVDGICLSNGIKRNSIELHLVEKNEMNAFAMPGGHLVVYTGLIKKTKNSDQLCGVLAHEIAHIQLNHVVEKLTAEIGITVLFSLLTNGDAHLIQEVLRNLSSTSFSRGLEKEADLKALLYMNKANINPIALSEFMKIMSQEEDDFSNSLEWFSTHPSSKNRLAYLKKEASKYAKQSFKSPVPEDEWTMIQQRL